MIGAIAGDIIGSRYEFNPIKTTDFELFGSDCRFTDDTVLTVALVEALVSGKDYCRLLKKYYRRYPNAGYGNSFKHWAADSTRKPYNSFGNGAAMRISPVGFYYNTLEEVLAKAEFYTAVTHNHPEGIKGAQATAAAIFLARNGSSKDEIRRYITDTFGYDLTRTCDQIRPGYSFDVTCQGTVPEAIICFLESTDYESAVRLAVSLGGDSDTLACITGGIAEGLYGMPVAIEKATLKYLDRNLRLVAEGFYKHMAFRLRPQLSELTEITAAELRNQITQWQESLKWIGDPTEYDHDVSFREELDYALAKYSTKYPLHKADAERIQLLDQKFLGMTEESEICVIADGDGKPTCTYREDNRLSSSEFRKKYWYYFRWPPQTDDDEEYESEEDQVSHEDRVSACNCDCCGGSIYYGSACIVFLHGSAQDEGQPEGYAMNRLQASDAVAHICAGCSNSFTNLDLIRFELSSELDIFHDESSPVGNDTAKCDKCGLELRTGHSRRMLDMLIAQIEYDQEGCRDRYIPIRADSLLELCATCGTAIGREEAKSAFHEMISEVSSNGEPDTFEKDEDWCVDEETIREHTSPFDPEKLAEAGIVTREHLKGRFFRVDIDWASSGVWETSRPCEVDGMGGNIDYEELELPDWLLNRFIFWEHWHSCADSHCDLPIDFDWESFSAYGRSLAVDLKYHLGPEISVCYRDKEVTLGPLFRDPVPKERK